MYEVLRYGPGEEQYGQVWPGRNGPGVVLLHGGNWRRRYGLDLMEPLAADLAARGYRVLNLEYRRVGSPGGGWPGTFDDIRAGLTAFGAGGYAVVGHSAGGQLALWAAHEVPGVRFAVSLAGVNDLVEGARQRLGDGAVAGFLGGGPDQVPERYAYACPTLRLPLAVPQLLVHGTADASVSYEFSAGYAAVARPCELVTLDGGDHFTVIDPHSAAWAATVARLQKWRAA
jgi:pimeloyl-ACP methyl ester carboxylesterase